MKTSDAHYGKKKRGESIPSFKYGLQQTLIQTLGIMSHPKSSPPKTRCPPCLVVLLVGLLLLVVVSGWVVRVVQKVFGGAGMEYCCSIEGVPFNYLAVFVLLCGVVAALLLVVVLQVREWRIRRDFERKYGVKVPASDRGASSFSRSDSRPSLHGVESGDGD